MATPDFSPLSLGERVRACRHTTDPPGVWASHSRTMQLYIRLRRQPGDGSSGMSRSAPRPRFRVPIGSPFGVPWVTISASFRPPHCPEEPTRENLDLLASHGGRRLALGGEVEARVGPAVPAESGAAIHRAIGDVERTATSEGTRTSFNSGTGSFSLVLILTRQKNHPLNSEKNLSLFSSRKPEATKTRKRRCKT